MGLHHFQLSMVPKSYFGTHAPATISANEIEKGQNANHGWWSAHQPSPETLKRSRELCLIDKSWGDTEEYVTSEKWGSDIRIWKTNEKVWDITFRFSPVSDDLKLLQRFVGIARDANCLLLDSETGELLQGDDTVVIERLGRSKAMRFVRDPKSAIVEGARKSNDDAI